MFYCSYARLARSGYVEMGRERSGGAWGCAVEYVQIECPKIAERRSDELKGWRMREWLRLFVRCLIGGACSVVLLSMGCRHSSFTVSGMGAAKGVPAHKVEYHGVDHEVKQRHTLLGI